MNFDEVRELALTLPGVEEGRLHGAPCLRVSGRLLCCPAIHRSAEPNSIVVSVDFDERARLITDEPEIHYVTDHYARHPVVLVRLEKIDRSSLIDLLRAAHRFADRNNWARTRNRGGTGGRALAALVVGLVLPMVCQADMGSIPFKRGVTIREPSQDAIIAWNGREQLLYLQTTLASSADTRVLEVMPLPSRPTVEPTEADVFERCASLLPRPHPPAEGGDSFGAAPGEPAARVVDRKQIGAHDLRTVELIDARRFAAWIAEEFREGEEGLTIPEPLLEVVGSYARDGFRWFLFDVVDVRMEPAKKIPLRIRFETDHLYYPLRITRTEKGPTNVSLSILTNVLFEREDCIGIPRSSIRVPARPVEISDAKVRWIDPLLFDLLGRPETAMLRQWTITGEIDAFEADLLIRHPSRRGESEQADLRESTPPGSDQALPLLAEPGSDP